jgi:hypothetical protein
VLLSQGPRGGGAQARHALRVGFGCPQALRQRQHHPVQVRQFAGAVDARMAGQDLLGQAGARAHHADDEHGQLGVQAERAHALEVGWRERGHESIHVTALGVGVVGGPAAADVFLAQLVAAAIMPEGFVVLPGPVADSGQREVQAAQVVLGKVATGRELLDAGQLVAAELVVPRGSQSAEAGEDPGVVRVQPQGRLILGAGFVDASQELHRCSPGYCERPRRPG